MSCQIDVDHDSYAELHSERVVTARKRHKCGECGDMIEPGEQYEIVEGLWDGEWSRHKTCLPCRNARRDLMCSFCYGEIWADIEEYFTEEADFEDKDDMEWLR